MERNKHVNALFAGTHPLKTQEAYDGVREYIRALEVQNCSMQGVMAAMQVSICAYEDGELKDFSDISRMISIVTRE